MLNVKVEVYLKCFETTEEGPVESSIACELREYRSEGWGGRIAWAQEIETSVGNIDTHQN
jgi:hypothetical protein